MVKSTVSPLPGVRDLTPFVAITGVSFVTSVPRGMVMVIVLVLLFTAPATPLMEKLVMPLTVVVAVSHLQVMVTLPAGIVKRLPVIFTVSPPATASE